MTLGPVRLRPASRHDLAAVERLLGELGYGRIAPAALPETLRVALARPDLALYLAIDRSGAAVGFLQLSHRPQPHLGGTLVCVDALVVTAAARGLGVGQRLLRRVRAYARAHRAVRVELHTNRARASYQRGFYRGHGYQEAHSALFRLTALEHGLTPALPASATDPNQ